MLARGWSLSERLRTALLLLVGVALAFNPFLVALAGVGTPAYEYRVQELTVETPERPADLVIGDDLRRVRIAGEGDIGIRGIACDGRPPLSRACVLERTLLDGHRTVPTGPAFVATDDEYVAIDGEFYCRTARRRSDGGAYGLRQVGPAAVVEGVSRDVDDAPGPVAAAVAALEGGPTSVTTATVRRPPAPRQSADRVLGDPSEHPGLSEGTVLRSGTDYYYVRLVAVRSDGLRYDPDSSLRGALSFVGVAVGLASLKRGYDRMTGLAAA